MRRTTITISLPSEMATEVERARESGHYTRSELVREALRFYLAVRRPFTPTAKEVREIEKGRAALSRGESYTLHDLFRGMVGARRPARPKTRRARTPT
ncbi:MAG: ribbon-helix-helix domain-containing protein [Planctomycetota bacterium]